MDLRLLEVFVGVAEEGSIHGGARRLLIAQPAVSKGLQRLERLVGTPLLVRSHRGVELTAAGSALLVQAREVLRHVDEAVEVVRAAGRTGPSLTVGLLAGPFAAADITTDLISAYRRQRPDVRLVVRDLDFSEQFDAVASGAVDVALVRQPCSDPRLHLQPLFDEPLVVCCSKDHPKSREASLTIDEVLDEPMLDLGGAPQEWADFWHLNDDRGGPARISSGPVVTLGQLQMAVTFDPVVTPLVSSVWRLAFRQSGLAGVPLVDSPRSQVAVATREADARSHVTDFVACSSFATRASIDRVPDATLLC